MVTAYLGLKWLHVLAAMVALGTNATYFVLLSRGAREPAHLLHTLRSVRFLDDRIANPAYILALLSGLGLAWLGAWPLATPWIAGALALFASVAGLGIGVYGPLLRREIAAVERDGPGSPEAARLAERGTRLGLVMLALVVAIVFLMVAKPAL